jgi:hypothetical protein
MRVKKTRMHKRWYKVSSNSFTRVHDIPLFKIPFQTLSLDYSISLDIGCRVLYFYISQEKKTYILFVQHIVTWITMETFFLS